MTTKKPVKKVFTLADFMTKDLNETATKMPLLFDGVDTGCFLMVRGIESKPVQRARIEAQVAYADMAEDAEKITDKTDRSEFGRDKKEQIEICLAVALVTGWSFGDFNKDKLQDLLFQNQGLAFTVIAHSTNAGNYLKK
jgi:hypothetical protein